MGSVILFVIILTTACLSIPVFTCMVFDALEHMKEMKLKKKDSYEDLYEDDE